MVPRLSGGSTLPRLLRHRSAPGPAPDQVLVVDGGSSDGTAGVARTAGWTVFGPAVGGWAAQINRDVAASRSAIASILPTDTPLPDDAVMRGVLAEERTVLAGLAAPLRGPETVRRGTSFHDWIRFWCAPPLFRPHLFWRGTRLPFGDHARFFRRARLLQVGGRDQRLRVMEDAGPYVRFGRTGRIRLVNRAVPTSDRRIVRRGAAASRGIIPTSDRASPDQVQSPDRQGGAPGQRAGPRPVNKGEPVAIQLGTAIGAARAWRGA